MPLFRFEIVGHPTLAAPVSLVLPSMEDARRHAQALLDRIKDTPACANGCRVTVLDERSQVLFELSSR